MVVFKKTLQSTSVVIFTSRFYEQRNFFKTNIWFRYSTF